MAVQFKYINNLGLLVLTLTLIVATIFSSMASAAANDGLVDRAKEYSMWAALTTGIVSAILIITVLVYVFYSEKGDSKGERKRDLF